MSIVSFKGELEFAGASADDKVGRVARFRIVKRPEDQGLAHPFAAGRRRKAKAPGTRFETALVSVETTDPVYAGETMLLGWTDGPGGSFVNLLLDDEAEEHPFFGYKRASRGSAGSRFMAAFAEIGDDEVVVNQAKKEAVEEPQHKHHEQRLSNFAAILSKDVRFHDWLREHVRDCEWNDKAADDWIKGVCKIESKRELDTPGEACDRFHLLIRRPFSDWRDEQEGGWR